jgi:hypothetical protein
MCFDLKIDDQDFINSLKHFDKEKDILRVNLTGTFEELHGNTFIYSNLFHSDYKFNVEVMLKIIFLCVHLNKIRNPQTGNVKLGESEVDNDSSNMKMFDLENIVLVKNKDIKILVSNIHENFQLKTKLPLNKSQERFNSYKEYFANEGKAFLEKVITSFLIGNIKPYAAFKSVDGVPSKLQDVLFDDFEVAPSVLLDNSCFNQNKISEIMNNERSVHIPSNGNIDLNRNYSYILYKDNTFKLSDFYGYEELLKMYSTFSFFLEYKKRSKNK